MNQDKKETPGTDQSLPAVAQDSSSEEASNEKALQEMEAGFRKVRGGEPPTKATPEKEIKEEAEEEPNIFKTPVENKDEGKEDAPVIGGLTETQIKALLARVPDLENKTNAEIRKLYGKIGEIGGSLKQFQENQVQSRPTRKIDASALKRLNEEFPDLANRLAADLTDLYGPEAEPKPGPKGQEPRGQETQEINLEQRVAVVQEEMQKDLLTFLHKDWVETANSDDFKLWFSSQPTEKRKYYDSPKAVVVAEALNVYKEQREKSQKAAEKNKKRLEESVVPEGTPGPKAHALTPEEQAERGFNRVRRGR